MHNRTVSSILTSDERVTQCIGLLDIFCEVDN